MLLPPRCSRVVLTKTSSTNIEERERVTIAFAERLRGPIEEMRMCGLTQWAPSRRISCSRAQ
jgi:hypothetical protein